MKFELPLDAGFCISALYFLLALVHQILFIDPNISCITRYGNDIERAIQALTIYGKH